MPIDMTQFHQVFFEETAEHLATMESLLLYLDPADPDPAQLDDLRRAAHSIKGSGATFGFREMVDLAQEVETLVEGVRKGNGRLSGEMLGALNEACGALRALLAGYRGDSPVEPAATVRAIGALRSHSAGRQETPGELAAMTGGLSELARQTATATNQVMALFEAAGAGGLGDVTEAVRGLGEAIEQNAALAERAAENAEALRESFRTLVQAIAGMALSPSGRSSASARPARSRPLPKVRRASGRAGNDKEWPEF